MLARFYSLPKVAKVFIVFGVAIGSFGASAAAGAATVLIHRTPVDTQAQSTQTPSTSSRHDGAGNQSANTIALQSPTPADDSATPSDSPTPTPSPSPSPASTSVPNSSATRSEVITEIRSIPYDKTTVESDDYPVGSSQVTTPGVNGQSTLSYRVSYVGDQQVSKVLINQVTTSLPVTEVTTIGTHPGSSGDGSGTPPPCDPATQTCN